VGGAGFIGSHLCDRLIEDEETSVFVADNLVTGNVCNVEHLYNHKRFKFINVDASKFRMWEHHLEDVMGCPHEIYYLASIASPKMYLSRPMETISANIDGLRNFLEVANRYRCKILYTSTSEVYGDPQVLPQPETYTGNVDTVCDRAIYDETKRVGETIAMAYRRKHGVDTRIVRIFNTYGPRMSPHDGRVVPTFVEQALEGKDFTLYGEGTQTRSFCYVSDTVDALLRVMSQEDHLPLNVGNPDEYCTMLDLATKIRGLVPNCKSGISFVPYISENDPQRRRPDIKAIGEATGWQPQIPLKEGLLKVIRSAQNL